MQSPRAHIGCARCSRPRSHRNHTGRVRALAGVCQAVQDLRRAQATPMDSTSTGPYSSPQGTPAVTQASILSQRFTHGSKPQQPVAAEDVAFHQVGSHDLDFCPCRAIRISVLLALDDLLHPFSNAFPILVEGLAQDAITQEQQFRPQEAVL